MDVTCKHCKTRSSKPLHGAGDFNCLSCCAHLVAKAMPHREMAAAQLAAVDRAIMKLGSPFTRKDVWDAALKLKRR